MQSDLRATTSNKAGRITSSMRQTRGFTLAELLIAVAIIGSLVAIAIPMFGSQQAYSRRRTDEANYNAAKEAATAKWLADGMPDGVSYCYDLGTNPEQHGTVVIDAPAGYGLSTASDWTTETYNMGPTYPVDAGGTPQFVRVSFNSKGITEAVWSTEAGSGSDSSSGNTGNSGNSGSIDNEIITDYTDKDGSATGGNSSGGGASGESSPVTIFPTYGTIDVIKGNLYYYNGTVYVANTSYTATNNQWYSGANPEQDNAQSFEAWTGRLISSSSDGVYIQNGKYVISTVNRGDIYMVVDEQTATTTYYIAHQYSSPLEAPNSANTSDGHWTKINGTLDDLSYSPN